MPAPSPEALRERFLEVHESAYGYANPHDPIEIVNVRLTARGRLIEPPDPEAPGDPGPLPEPFERRPVRFAVGDVDEGIEGGDGVDAAERAEEGTDTGIAGPPGAGDADCPVYHRQTLRPGHVLDGPAIIEQLDSTTPICPGDRAVVDPAGNLAIRIHGGAGIGP